jgi:hypothetical protein
MSIVNIINANYTIFISIGYSIDNGNIVFLLLIQLLFPKIIWLGNFESKTIRFP